MGTVVIGFEPNDFLELADGFVELALSEENLAKAGAGVGVIRFKRRASWY